MKIYKSHRKDHLKQHMKNSHDKEMKSLVECPQKPCHCDGELLFSSKQRVEVHLYQNHGNLIHGPGTSRRTTLPMVSFEAAHGKFRPTGIVAESHADKDPLGAPDPMDRSLSNGCFDQSTATFTPQLDPELGQQLEGEAYHQLINRRNLKGYGLARGK